MALSKIDLDKAGVTGTLPTSNLDTVGVAQGGTGITSGTTDQFLKFTGTTTIASAVDNAGSLVKIATVNSTSDAAFVELQNCFNTTYQSYLVILRKVLPSTNLAGLRMRLMTGTNTPVNSSNYAYASRYFDHDGAVSSNTGNNQSSWQLADEITSSVSDFGSATGVFWFSIDTDNSSGTSGKYTGTMTFGNTQHSSYQGGKYHSSYGSTTTTGLEWFATSGNISKLQATCYGVIL